MQLSYPLDDSHVLRILHNSCNHFIIIAKTYDLGSHPQYLNVYNREGAIQRIEPDIHFRTKLATLFNHSLRCHNSTASVHSTISRAIDSTIFLEDLNKTAEPEVVVIGSQNGDWSNMIGALYIGKTEVRRFIKEVKHLSDYKFNNSTLLDLI